jgi:hypothetical protein
MAFRITFINCMVTILAATAPPMANNAALMAMRSKSNSTGQSPHSP